MNSRDFSTDREGYAFSKPVINAVWELGEIISGKDPHDLRKDIFGKVMQYSEYKNRQSEYGWEIDHIDPVSNNGTDDLYNLQPLNWRSNDKKGESRPY